MPFVMEWYALYCIFILIINKFSIFNLKKMTIRNHVCINSTLIAEVLWINLKEKSAN